MRFAFAVATAALLAGTAFADEPAACYVANDPSGDFATGQVQPIDANPRVAAQIRHLLNESNRATARCIQKFTEREGNFPPMALLYGVRISPAGKPSQVSVLASNNVNDAMLMACIGRLICAWELEPDADGQERLVSLPPYVMRSPMRILRQQ
jgi:hypothetical protein